MASTKPKPKKLNYYIKLRVAMILLSS